MWLIGVALIAIILARILFIALMVACGVPHVVIERSVGQVYMRRWWILPRNNWCNIYLHQFLLSDEPRLHDHPYSWISIVLKGGYFENLYKRACRVVLPGSIRYGKATDLHYITLFPDWSKGNLRGTSLRPAWTIFITGRRKRDWGFLILDKWVPWRQVLRNGSEIC